MFGLFERKWVFTRFDPSGSKDQFFRKDLRQIACGQPDYNLPWDDGLYLIFPSLDSPDWLALVALVEKLNAEADADTQYKIVIMVRRAHKETHDSTVLDPALDDEGKEQCHELRVKFGGAMHTHHLPTPEVIITSPLARALQTTQLGITPLFPSVPVVVHESLRERVRRGKRNKRHEKEEIATEFPTFNVDCVDDIDPYKSFDGKETYQAMWQRVQGALAYVCEKYKEASVVLVVTHCYVMQAIQREITGWDVSKRKRKETVEFYLGEAGVYAMVLKGSRQRLVDLGPRQMATALATVLIGDLESKLSNAIENVRRRSKLT